MGATIDQRVLPIEAGMPEPDPGLLALVGSKAFNLMRLAAMGLPVPPAFVLSTGYCQAWLAAGGQLEGLRERLASAIRRLEQLTGSGFGDARRPLLVSVRSGAAVSMPGMLETLLDVGLGERTVSGLLRLTGNPRLVWDSLRRLVEMHGEVIAGVAPALFEAALHACLREHRTTTTAELHSLGLRELAQAMLHVHAANGERPFPQDPQAQLLDAVEAVFRSWVGPRASAYRRLNGLEALPGTAVTVQAMVFGNAGVTSGSGVAFSRDPATGENRLYLDFAFDAQGEDVVSGRREPGDAETLAQALPEVHRELEALCPRLERAFGDAQDLEFTVQQGRLWLLQTRTAKRTPWAALRMVVEMAEAGLIAPEEARRRVAAIDPARLVRRRLVQGGAVALGRAVSASPGVAAGPIALDVEAAERQTQRATPAVLVREDLGTDDIAGLHAAAGVLTAHGGRTSHAAVVARQLGKVCLVGCAALSIDRERRCCRIGDHRVHEGDWLTLDGDSGAVYEGRLDTVDQRSGDWLARLSALEPLRP